ncbi:MAG: radical SAM protein [Planctomycetota bacterium]
MRILFSNPPWWEGREHHRGLRWRWRGGVRAGSRWPFTLLQRSAPDRYVFGDYCPYPFFLGYAATYVRERTGADVHFRDSIALKESYDSFYAYVEGLRPEMIVVESATPSWEHDAKVLAEVRRRLPGVKVVVTGPITTTRGGEILESEVAVACVQGEYEKGVTRVVQGETGLLAPDLLTREEMNAAPFPWYDELHAHRYSDGAPKGQVFPHAQVWSSRGCPFKCIFCVWPATMTGNDPDGSRVRTVRHYTPEYMEAFLTEIVGRHGYRSIYFDDDTFNLGSKHVTGMCGVMSRIGLPWSAMCRADTSSLESWKQMADSGCFGVKLGFESGDQYVVDKIVNKHLDLERAKEVVHEIKRLGMTVHGTFTYGLPGETHAQMLTTKRFIASLPFDTVQESGTAEIEGTPLHTLRVEGKLDEYAGAAVDADYRRETDGSKKFQSLAKSLRES